MNLRLLKMVLAAVEFSAGVVIAFSLIAVLSRRGWRQCWFRLLTTPPKP